jgi:hypothetical protein
MPRIRHGTLEPDEIEEVNLGVDVGEVEVMNVDGAEAIYVRTDGEDPEVEGEDSYVIPAVIGSTAIIPVRTAGPTVVKLISAGTVAFSVTAEFA